MQFRSDNAGIADPRVIEEMSRINTGYTGGYGNDEITSKAAMLVRTLFEAPDALVYFVPTGTAANALALASFVRPFDAVYCHKKSHIENDEGGAPELFTNSAKLITLAGENGKLDPDTLRRAIEDTARLGVHNIQRGMVSVTNLTELGTAYTLDELKVIVDIAKSFELPVHLDGARFSNAVVGLNASPAEMSWKLGIDVAVFGGTKNGLMGAEAVVIFDKDKAFDFEMVRKRGGHLLSKGRYLSGQFIPYIEENIWRENARRANAKMRALVDELSITGKARALFPVDGNMAFLAIPNTIHDRLTQEGASYYEEDGYFFRDMVEADEVAIRLVTDSYLDDALVEKFITYFR